jgi:hypothetical protein
MEYKSTQFKNDEVRLDGNAFVGCSFNNCVLVYGGGPLPVMINNSLKDVRWDFREAASNTIQFMTAIYHGMGEGGRQLVEQTIENIRKNAPKK